MGRDYFEFKQFTVHQDQCAMKVGTDGVLAGAWAELPATGHVLDIGTGSGLMALMAAQRCEAHITGIDNDLAALLQARSNAEASPWKERISMVHADIKEFAKQTPTQHFEAILSNPPFFTESVASPDARRHAARHTDALSYTELLQAVACLLSPTGVFSVILPATSAPGFIAEAWDEGLHLKRRTWVSTKADTPPRRVLMTFSPVACVETATNTLVLEEAPGIKSGDYRQLTAAFYLFA